MIETRFVSVLNSPSREDFRDQVITFARDIGFEKIGALVVVDRLDGSSDFINIDNAPPAFRSSFEDYSIGRRDPVMQHCRYRSIPIVWDQGTYVSAGQGNLWEHQAAFGYRHGIGVAMHLPYGRHFMFGVDRDQAMPTHAGEVTRLVSDVQLFTVYAQEAATRLFALTPDASEERPHLSPRELETLRWTMEGMTAWQIGKKLAISERTVALHLIHASRKLGCSNKTQAVARALRMGLVQ